MFGIGFWEMLMIGGLVLVAVGPERLPSMIKSIARLYRQARRAATDIRQSTGIDDVLRDDELKELAALRNQKIQLLGGPASAKPTAAKPVPGKSGTPDGALAKPVAGDANAAPVEGKPMPIEGKPMPVEGKPFGKPSVPVTGAMDAPVVLRGLSLEDRRRELPIEGVDVLWARAHTTHASVRDGEAA